MRVGACGIRAAIIRNLRLDYIRGPRRLTCVVNQRRAGVVGVTPMKRTPTISETEWEIMRVIWAHHPITAADVIARLTEVDASWHPKTARTLLARLVAKKALDYQ